jgi:Domain of unknown function (DUF4386)
VLTTGGGKGSTRMVSDQRTARIFASSSSSRSSRRFLPWDGYIASTGHDNRIFLGAFLELLHIVANIGTAVVLFPIAKRYSEGLALGYVTARLFECAFILVGIRRGPGSGHVAARGRGSR